MFPLVQPIFRSYVATSLVRDLLARVSFAEQFVHSGECPETNLCLDPSIQVLYGSPTPSSGTSKRASRCSKKKDDDDKRRLATQPISCDLSSLRPAASASANNSPFRSARNSPEPRPAGESEDVETQPPQMSDITAFHASLQAAHDAAEARRVRERQAS